MFERVFGRIESPDSRDDSFPVSSVLPTIPPTLKEKYWWADGWWGDQGSTSHCVAYSWMHAIEDGPIIQDSFTHVKPLISPEKLYKESQLRDPWAGEKYNGTTVRAAAKILKDLGIIKEYRWAKTMSDIISTLLVVGPIVVGTKWYDKMNTPDANGIIKPTGTNLGGHAYVLNGINIEKGYIRIKNSWGKKWGKDGFAFIAMRDFEKLLLDGGDACIAIETKINENLDWNKIRAPGIYTD